jgi:hypothetical protein
VTFDGLAWFRRRQRKLARSVLALFCLTWLQLATLPCGMVAAASNPAFATLATAPVTMHAMPSTHETGADHCLYCPPASDEASSTVEPGACNYPQDPQVDARAGLALGLALPAAILVPVFTAGIDTSEVTLPDTQRETAPRPSLAVSYCRFLK